MSRQEFGDVVNVSSQAGKHGYADVPSYCASKHALLGFAESLRDHVRKTGANVRVFNFCPGLVEVENAAADARRRAPASSTSRTWRARSSTRSRSTATWCSKTSAFTRNDER